MRSYPTVRWLAEAAGVSTGWAHRCLVDRRFEAIQPRWGRRRLDTEFRKATLLRLLKAEVEWREHDLEVAATRQAAAQIALWQAEAELRDARFRRDMAECEVAVLEGDWLRSLAWLETAWINVHGSLPKEQSIGGSDE